MINAKLLNDSSLIHLIHWILLISIGSSLIFSINCQVTANNNFAKAIAVATSIYTRSDEWRRVLEDYRIIFKAPECPLEAKDFPSNLNFTRKYLTVCGEAEAVYPWKYIHEKSGELLVKTIAEQYKIAKLEKVFLYINTSEGYFYSMKRAVDTGYCDVAVASTNWSPERAKAVHFQCPYASSYFGFLRSEMDPQIITRNETDMNCTGFSVVVLIDTITDRWATLNLKKANIIRVTTYEDGFNMIMQKQAHSLIADSMDLLMWLSVNRNNCPSCYVKAFGENFAMGSFISSKMIDSSSTSSIHFSPILFILLFFLFIINKP